jgi:hypothetical protein
VSFLHYEDAELTTSFINEDESDPEEDVVEEGPDGVQRRITPAEARRKKRRTLRQDLERAAGGALTGQV